MPKSKKPWIVAPSVYKHIFENRYVRILEAQLKPGASTPLHAHFRRIVYAVKGSLIKAVDEKGKKQTLRFKDNKMYVLPAMTHAPKNIDKKKAHYISIEFKK